MKNKNVLFALATVFVMLLSLGNPALSQRYKEKDDIIYLGKQEVGKVEGEAGQKAGLTIYGLNGEKVLIVKLNFFPANNPFLTNLYWYTIRFPDTGKFLSLYFRGSCRTKCLLNNVLAYKDIIIDGGPIKGQDEIIKKHDVTKEITKDTAETSTKHKQMIRLLKSNRIPRAKDMPVMLLVESETVNGYTTKTIFDITQDNIIIGRIVKTRVASSTRVAEEYDVFEKLYEPEDGIVEVPACRVTSMFTDLEFYTTVDNKKHVIPVRDRTQVIDVPKVLASYLVANGYL